MILILANYKEKQLCDYCSLGRFKQNSSDLMRLKLASFLAVLYWFMIRVYKFVYKPNIKLMDLFGSLIFSRLEAIIWKFLYFIQIAIFNILNILKLEQPKMLKAFITAPQYYQPQAKEKQAIVKFSDSEQLPIQQQIKHIIYSMPSHQICQQAASNIGLPKPFLDFQRLLQKIEEKQNKSNLAYIYQSLKNFQKEANRLKKQHIFTEKSISKQTVPSRIRRNSTHKATRQVEPQQNIQQDQQQKLKKILLEELAIRKRKNVLNSTQKLQRKQIFIKERIEKIKVLNKKALKVYNSYKEKQQKSYDFFKIQTLYTPKAQPIKTQSPASAKSDKSNLVIHQIPERNHLPLKSSKGIETNDNTQVCNTAISKRRKRQYLTTSQNISQLKECRFTEYKNRQRATQLKRKQFERQKQELSLYMAIKKQQRINELHSRQFKKHKQQKQQVKIQSQLLITQNNLSRQLLAKPKQGSIDSDSEIKAKCEQKQFKRQLQLQQRVNNIRQQLRVEQERRKRHRLNKSIQCQQKQQLNQMLLRDCLNRYKSAKDQQLRHEMTIKMRLELRKAQENYNKLANSVSKLTESQIQKQLSRIREKQRQRQKPRMNL